MLSRISLHFATASLNCRNYSSFNTYIDQKPKPDDSIFVAMSSGVDSSVSAALLRQKYPKNQIIGLFMANWNTSPDGNGYCERSEADWLDVQQVANSVGIKAHRLNFEKEYWSEVFSPMIEMYSKGLTPNPDVGCNKHIKFGSLTDYIRNNMVPKGFDNWWLATGHYASARLHVPSNSVHLLRPAHLPKDQSYYLSSISPSILPHILFPLATYTKPQVRELAHQFNLPTASKPDSQGLCFVQQSSASFRKFLSEYLDPSPGPIYTSTGVQVGEHQGLWHATVGQKSGLCLPQSDPAMRGVWYVAAKDPVHNALIVVQGVDNPELYCRHVSCDRFEFLGSVDLAAEKNIRVQYRSLQDEEPVVSVKRVGDGIEVELASDRRAIAAGQYLVLYNDQGRVLGSGVITNTRKQS